MNREEFCGYIIENFDVSAEFCRLLNNVLIFIEERYQDNEEQYKVLNELLNGTIGLSEREIRKVEL